MEDISGQEVISFRSPALRVNGHTTKALIETGHKIDSSVASQRFDFFLSFGGTNKLKWLRAPRLPYKTDENNLFRKGKGPLVEVPLSAFGFPYTSTTMRVFPKLTSIQKHFINAESKLNKKPIVFDIHPNEFIDESSEQRKINRRSKNFLAYLLKDYIRGNLKVKNLGKDAIPLYENLISYYKKKGYRMVTIREYCEEVGLLDSEISRQ